MQTFSFRLGYARGLEARPFTAPWWVDRIVYSLAYAEGAKERGQRQETKLEDAAL
jgi:hypothetical protein